MKSIVKIQDTDVLLSVYRQSNFQLFDDLLCKIPKKFYTEWAFGSIDTKKHSAWLRAKHPSHRGGIIARFDFLLSDSSIEIIIRWLPIPLFEFISIIPLPLLFVYTMFISDIHVIIPVVFLLMVIVASCLLIIIYIRRASVDTKHEVIEVLDLFQQNIFGETTIGKIGGGADL
jgi:hypothetical protein